MALLLAGVNIAHAKKTTTTTTTHNTPTISPEQQQQFLYYFYQAEQLILQDKIQQARPIVEFCYLLNPNDATINHYMGCYAQEDDNPLQMLYYFKKAFELQPNEYWYRYNVLLLQTENNNLQKQAIHNLQQVAQDNLRNDELHQLLFNAYLATNNIPGALTTLDRIDSINVYTEQSALQRYKLNNSINNTKQALYDVERFLDLDPNSFQLQVLRLQLCEQTKQKPAKIIDAYQNVLKFDSRNLMLINNLAWNLCIHTNEYERAEQLSRTTIMADPRNPIYLDTYAWIAFHLGDCEAALFYIEKAIENITPETQKDVKQHYKKIIRKCKK